MIKILISKNITEELFVISLNKIKILQYKMMSIDMFYQIIN